MLEIRKAVPGDREAARVLIRAYLDQMREQGSEVIPTDRTVDFFVGVFDAYLDGTTPGVVLVSEQNGKLNGLTMAGHDLPFDTIYGRTATGWMTFVDKSARGHGTGTHLRAALRAALVEMGYRAIAAGYHTWNDQSRRFVERRGFKSLQVYGIETLNQPSVLAESA